MSVRTPILTTSSETCASAAVDASIAAASAPNMDRLLGNIPSSPCGSAHWPLCVQAVAAANWSHLQLNWPGVNLAGRRGLTPSGIGFCLFPARFRAYATYELEPALAGLADAARCGARRPVERRR